MMNLILISMSLYPRPSGRRLHWRLTENHDLQYLCNFKLRKRNRSKYPDIFAGSVLPDMPNSEITTTYEQKTFPETHLHTFLVDPLGTIKDVLRISLEILVFLPRFLYDILLRFNSRFFMDLTWYSFLEYRPEHSSEIVSPKKPKQPSD